MAGCTPPVQDPGVARAALKQCAQQLRQYEACAAAHLPARALEVVQAPQVYREQAKGLGST